MSWPVRILLTLFLLLALFVVTLFIFMKDVAKTPRPLQTGIVHALIINNNDDREITLDQVLEGEDGLLVYVSDNLADAEQSEPATLFTFNNFSSLMHFDDNGDGYIDGTDPVFSKLYLAHLDRDEDQLNMVPLLQAGITGIIFNHDFIATEKEQDMTRFEQTAGIAVFADSSRWPIQVLPMDTAYLERLHIQLSAP